MALSQSTRVCVQPFTHRRACWALERCAKGERQSKQSNWNEHHSSYIPHTKAMGTPALSLTHSLLGKILRQLSRVFIANSNTSFPFSGREFPNIFHPVLRLSHSYFPHCLSLVALCYDLIPLFIHIGISCINYGPLIVPETKKQKLTEQQILQRKFFKWRSWIWCYHFVNQQVFMLLWLWH